MKKTLLLILFVACAGVLLSLAVQWVLAGDSGRSAGAESARHEAHPKPSAARGAPVTSRPIGGARSPIPFASLEGALETDDGSEPEEGPFPWRMRDPPQVDGPVIASDYAPGQPEFRGTQVLGSDGKWVRDGAWTAWYENGQLCELGAYRAGVEDGLWQWWYEDGTRMAEGAWVDGERVGEWTFWHESGALGLVASYTAGEGSGLWTLYYESGVKCAQGAWENGAPSGHWNVWNEDGTLDLERTGTYVDGQKID